MDKQSDAQDADRLWRAYEIAVEEYRFQIDLNWKRSQYYFVLNALILATAIGVLSASTPVADEIIGALFGLGAVMALLALFAIHTQNAYYHAARDHMKDVAQKMELGDLSLRTTPGLGGAAKRFGRVTTFQFTMLGAILTGDVIGALVAFSCL